MEAMQCAKSRTSSATELFQRIKRTAAVALVALATTAGGRGNAAETPLAGSDLLAPLLAKPVAEFNRDNPHPLKLQLNGTLAALADLKADRVPLAVIALKPGETLDKDAFRSVALAYTAAVFAVPAGSAARTISLEQLAAIFGEAQGGDARRWSDLGFTGEWSAKAISAHAFVAPGSLALELFRNTALRSPELRSNIGMHATLAALADRAGADEGAIALLSSPRHAAGRLVLLPVSRGTQDAAVAPTPENIHSGEYPLRLPFVVAFKPARRAEVFEAVRFLLSEEIAVALEAGDLVAVPREARNAALFELEAGK